MNEDPSISPEESGRNSESEEEKFEEPPQVDGMAKKTQPKKTRPKKPKKPSQKKPPKVGFIGFF